jgi:hypothetical protein
MDSVEDQLVKLITKGWGRQDGDPASAGQQG